MWFVDKEALVAGLKGAQKHNCCYIGNTCDCKYGLRESMLDKKAFYQNLGEYTGCPELRQVIFMLENMDVKTFNKLLKIKTQENDN